MCSEKLAGMANIKMQKTGTKGKFHCSGFYPLLILALEGSRVTRTDTRSATSGLALKQSAIKAIQSKLI